ncbi:MarR family winged helix-turn-helix transcriptional regulator [Marinitenerispora sediminis]|uniref:MarR family transcriptional regulator n=1 Tax=Marinitenerispora sediminis TaxID=1931232 RepID=A0A368T2A9_9ACTN|nr:MarR family transcriptional regulator [Marinitenerispora sediminis]RCV50083.1 MarR family transcriptional regulator [Marinitenerispora sediminis]RCV55502.1 MarR family transcriptional regulator [Marinitenerispora sediminis]RCV57612.1 MarR family transcriptional regulator [Marinitenerispora sediminis]
MRLSDQPPRADDAPASDAPAGTGTLLGQAARLAADEFAEALRPHGLRPRDARVLAHIDAAGPRSQQEIGRTLGIDRTTMVGVVDHLTEKGLVERVRDPRDRRRYEVRLTREGTSVYRDHVAHLTRDADARLLAPLNTAERATLHRLLVRLLRRT